ncbi:hypothetical protein M514_06413 [Trichuris suis]|uniref:Uncharacterized protein n=1 Tax=Trichuris suis TaxID=68888 RepID=A0A085M6B1_9BILA|nr:hypothetical protein M513_06413 [Trichuris suis]KFD71543.1 hypothetical protein M514_06413 [Trichuris suis]KHJ42750.1 hypothetical protein D918_07250 [Trichuris suis]
MRIDHDPESHNERYCKNLSFNVIQEKTKNLSIRYSSFLEGDEDEMCICLGNNMLEILKLEENGKDYFEKDGWTASNKINVG